MKRTWRAVLLSVLIFSLMPLIEAFAAPRYVKGDPIQDFNFTTYDGQRHSFNEILQEKDAVLLNIWASWCSPCRHEFPFMQEAYAEYQDRVEIIALSCESTDTPKKLKEFAESNGLTFMIGQAPQELLYAVGVSSIPVSLMIDRYGVICFLEAGAQPDADSFRRLFECFIGNEYQESIVLDAIPSETPDVDPSESYELSAALGCQTSNPTSRFVWPMVAAEMDGRSVVESTNQGKPSSRAEIIATVEAKAGDAVSITFKTSTEEVYDLLSIIHNGKTVRHFGGEHDWTSYAIPVDTTGLQTIKISYIKDQISDAGNDKVWIDSVEVVENAPEAIATNPFYPVASVTEIIPITPQAKEVIISDPAGLLNANFGAVRCYIANDDTVSMNVSLASDVDPECALVYFSYDQSQYPVTKLMTSERYNATTKVDSAQTTGNYCTFAAVYPDIRKGNPVTTLLFMDEDNLNDFVQRNALGDWHYADISHEQEITQALGTAVYTIYCIDQTGTPVPGVMLQVCNENICQIYSTDNNGLVSFEAEALPWEIHVLMAPSSYKSISSEYIAPKTGGEIVIELMKN